MAIISDIMQINEPINQAPQLSVFVIFISIEYKFFSKIFFSQLKLKAALFVDSLLTFTRQINNLIGTDSNRLFGIDGISLKNSEIYIGSNRGINCTLNSLSVDNWPLGKLVLNGLMQVKLK